MSEIVSVREALRRVDLESLTMTLHEDVIVEWTGYPKPFRCSHDAVYGFGPLDQPDKNDPRGSGRRYQKSARVNQYFCGGDVLFS